MLDTSDTPESDLGGGIDARDIETLRGRIQENLIETPNNLVEQVYDQWRVARDQLTRAKDLIDKALVRLSADLSTYFISIEGVILSVQDISDTVNDITHFVIEGTENLAAKRKRGSKRENGKSIVRTSKKELIGAQTINHLPGNKKEVKTLIEYIDSGGGYMMPKYRVEIVDDTDASCEEVITEEINAPTIIQRPSLEKKETNA